MLPKTQLIAIRTAAFLIEIIIPNFISMVLYPSPSATGLGVFVVIYLLFKDGIDGQSLAKRVLKLQVIDESTGLPCGLLKSLQRNIILLIPFASLIELVVMLYSADGRRLGDRMAKTRVIPVAPEIT